MTIDPIYLSPSRMAKKDAAQARKMSALFSSSPEELHAQAAERMAKIDALPRPMRELVHEHGWLHVKRFIETGEHPEDQRRRFALQVLAEELVI